MVEIKLVINGVTRKDTFNENTTLLTQLRDRGIFVNALCGGIKKCKKCKILVDDKVCLACETYPKKGQRIELLDFENSNLRICNANYSDKYAILAIDLGTTTIDFALVNTNNETIYENKVTNTQVIYGADVITRIKNSHGSNLAKMQKLVIDVINCQIDFIRLSLKDVFIKQIIVSGNATMLHIFYNESIESLGVAPYTPVFLENRSVNAKQLGIKAECDIFTASNISTFVGSDILLGILYVGFPQSNNYNVLIDLGTNAEIAVFNKDACIATAAAAGPCFEGANISCGMNALVGAIYSVEKNGECKVIGNTLATGICGTGLIEAVEYMVSNNIIDEYGYLDSDSGYELCNNITLTQQDIREFQLAKSAIYSALICLLESDNIKNNQIETIYLSGGFSNYLDISKAIKVGLLPKAFENKYKAIGNSSLQGAIMYASEKQDIDSYVKKAKYVDLSCNKRFSELFIENMQLGDYNEK